MRHRVQGRSFLRPLYDNAELWINALVSAVPFRGGRGRTILELPPETRASALAEERGAIGAPSPLGAAEGEQFLNCRPKPALPL